MHQGQLSPTKRRFFWQNRGKKFWAVVAAAAVVVVILAVAVPLAVVLPNSRKHKTPPGSVILPLYIYPHDNSTWSPVYEALKTHPTLNFTIVVNPNSGPGNDPAPNAQYTEAITTLSSYPNARLLGYVRTGYATRNLSQVLDDVSVYAGWSSLSSSSSGPGSLAMHGIFLDEAPHIYDPDAVEYMRKVGEHIKSSQGLYEPRTIVHNPGTLPAEEYLLETRPDITVIFEQSYEMWTSGSESMTSEFVSTTSSDEFSAKLSAASTSSPNGGGRKSSFDRSAYSLMVHSIPSSVLGGSGGNEDSYDLHSQAARDFLNGLSEKAEYLFVTTNDVNYYESFGADWESFVAGVPTSS